jgi:hypothetical protein
MCRISRDVWPLVSGVKQESPSQRRGSLLDAHQTLLAKASLASIRSSRRTISSRRLICEIDASQMETASVTMIGKATGRNC